MLNQEDDQEPIERIPYLDPQTVKVFGEIFPPPVITAETTMAEDKFNGGIQHVLKYMRTVVKFQQEGS